MTADPANTEALFWSLTPRRVMSHIDVSRRRFLRERNMRMEIAYHASLVPHQKKVLPLADYLLSDEAPRKQTPEERLATAQRWAAAMSAR